MARATVVGDVDVDVQISQQALDRLVRRGGIVHNYMDDVVDDAWVTANRMAPISSGDLRRGLDREVTTASRTRCTATLGTTGVPHATHFLLGHAGSPGGTNKPIGAALTGRGVAFGFVNQRPKKKFRGTPTMFTMGPTRGFAGNDILTRAMNEALTRRGLRGLNTTTSIFE